MMMNRIKLSADKSFQAVLLLLGILLIVGCGGSTTVADTPNNFSGNYQGTVNNQGGGAYPATLNLIQSSASTGTGNNVVTTVVIRGLLIINPSATCEFSIDITQGIVSNNSIIIELGTTTSTSVSGDDVVITQSDSGDMGLTASGNTLRGNIRFTPNPPAGCLKPSGTVIFQR